MSKLLVTLIAAALAMGPMRAMAGESSKTATKGPAKVETPAVAASVSAVGNLAGPSGGGAAAAAYAKTAASPADDAKTAATAATDAGTQGQRSVDNINDNMPNRISTNVTVPKQTQGATFGEKVNQGLHASGGALSQGAAVVGGALPGGAVISAKAKQGGEEVLPEAGNTEADAAAKSKHEQ